MEEIKLKISWKTVGTIFFLNLVLMGLVTWLTVGVQVFTLPDLSIIAIGWVAISIFISLMAYNSQPPLVLENDRIRIGKDSTKQVLFRDVSWVLAGPGGMKIQAGSESIMFSNFYTNYKEGRRFLEQKLSGRIREESYNRQLVSGVLMLSTIIIVLSLLG